MNSDWQWVQLGEISEVISKGTTPTTHGVAFLDSGIPFLRAEDVVGGAVDVNSVKYYIDEKTHNKLLSRSQLQPGDFLITIAGSLGRVGYVPLNAPPLNCNQAVAFVRLKPNAIDLNFLLYVFQYEGITKSLLDVQKVGTIGNLNLEQIRNFKIPLPPLTEQKRIASLLARADRLRQLRRTAHTLADSLLQSVFLEMFGDVVKNEKGFDVFPLEELSTRITKGESPNWQGFSYEESGVLFITSENVLWGSLDISYPKYISEKFHNKLKRSQLAKNDLLINLVGASIGRAALVTDDALPANINQAVATVSIDTTKLNLYFALYQILNPYKQNQLLGNIVESARANISLTNISELNLIVPPLSLQEEFAGVVARVEALRARMSEAERQAQGLFESLLHEAFSG